jgi:ferritin-like metal-binding protein YciE
MALLSLRDAFRHQLGVVYDAEQQVLGILDEIETETGSTELRDRIRTQREAKHRQITNVTSAFELLGSAPPKVESHTLRGLRAERAALRALAPSQPVVEASDLLALDTASQATASLYGGLCDLGRRVGADDVVRLLGHNFETEHRFGEWVRERRAALLSEIEPAPRAPAPAAAL